MAFNETGSLEKTVREIDTTLAETAKPYEIVIINDGSSDNTGTIADRLAKGSNRVRVIHHETNRGLGGTYRTGFAHAVGDLVTFFPADGQFPAKIIKEFLPLMDGADMVLGYLPKRNGSRLSKCLSGAERILFKILFGPMPKFQGVFMFKRSLLNAFELMSSGRGWVVVMEFIMRAKIHKYKIISVPTGFRSRTHGKSKINNLSAICSNLHQAIMLRWCFKRGRPVIKSKNNERNVGL